MPTNEEIMGRIFQALDKKAEVLPQCPICQKVAWTVGNLYVVMPLSANPSETRLGGPVYPLMPIICSNCGNTHFLNLLILGFTSEDLKTMGLSVDAGK